MFNLYDVDKSIISSNIKILNWEDIMEDNNLLFNAFKEFETMAGRVNFQSVGGLIHAGYNYHETDYVQPILITEIQPHEKRKDYISMFGSIRKCDDRLHVTTIIGINIDEMYHDHFNIYTDIWKEQLIRLYMERHGMIDSMKFIKQFIDGDKAMKYFLSIRDKYFQKTT